MIGHVHALYIRSIEPSVKFPFTSTIVFTGPRSVTPGDHLTVRDRDEGTETVENCFGLRDVAAEPEIEGTARLERLGRWACDWVRGRE